ncbi:MAG: 1-acyl-sn-glycerol-3-phosphate acyltransferase [Clostridiaceae bacterium]|nr:1-acyl-sn-glycerol-3-phosphate acyltransferase [Clostridiaceae bacterium]
MVSMERLVRRLCTIFFKLFYRVEIVGISNVPQKGGVILCSNHPTLMDMFFIAYKIKRLVHYMAKEELFRNPVLAYILSKLGAFPVKRGKADIESIKTAIRMVKEGHIVGILPEGTRTGVGNKKKVKPKPGVALIATKVNAPIVPVAISGNFKLFSKIKIVYGKPIYLDVDEEKKYSMDELKTISQKIMDKIYSLMGTGEK